MENRKIKNPTETYFCGQEILKEIVHLFYSPHFSREKVGELFLQFMEQQIQIPLFSISAPIVSQIDREALVNNCRNEIKREYSNQDFLHLKIGWERLFITCIYFLWGINSPPIERENISCELLEKLLDFLSHLETIFFGKVMIKLLPKISPIKTFFICENKEEILETCSVDQIYLIVEKMDSQILPIFWKCIVKNLCLKEANRQHLLNYFIFDLLKRIPNLTLDNLFFLSENLIRDEEKSKMRISLKTHKGEINGDEYILQFWDEMGKRLKKLPSKMDFTLKNCLLLYQLCPKNSFIHFLNLTKISEIQIENEHKNYLTFFTEMSIWISSLCLNDLLNLVSRYMDLNFYIKNDFLGTTFRVVPRIIENLLKNMDFFWIEKPGLAKFLLMSGEWDNCRCILNYLSRSSIPKNMEIIKRTSQFLFQIISEKKWNPYLQNYLALKEFKETSFVYLTEIFIDFPKLIPSTYEINQKIYSYLLYNRSIKLVVPSDGIENTLENIVNFLRKTEREVYSSFLFNFSMPYLFFKINGEIHSIDLMNFHEEDEDKWDSIDTTQWISQRNQWFQKMDEKKYLGHFDYICLEREIETGECFINLYSLVRHYLKFPTSKSLENIWSFFQVSLKKYLDGLPIIHFLRKVILILNSRISIDGKENLENLIRQISQNLSIDQFHKLSQDQKVNKILKFFTSMEEDFKIFYNVFSKRYLEQCENEGSNELIIVDKVLFELLQNRRFFFCNICQDIGDQRFGVKYQNCRHFSCSECIKHIYSCPLCAIPIGNKKPLESISIEESIEMIRENIKIPVKKMIYKIIIYKFIKMNPDQDYYNNHQYIETNLFYIANQTKEIKIFHDESKNSHFYIVSTYIVIFSGTKMFSFKIKTSSIPLESIVLKNNKEFMRLTNEKSIEAFVDICIKLSIKLVDNYQKIDLNYYINESVYYYDIIPLKKKYWQKNSGNVKILINFDGSYSITVEDVVIDSSRQIEDIISSRFLVNWKRTLFHNFLKKIRLF